MINVKPDVLQALESNQELVSLLGGSYIYQIRAPVQDNWNAWISFFEFVNVDDAHADDEPYSSDIRIQVDIWARDNETRAISTDQIAAEVDKSMKELGFRRTYSIDFYEEDSKIFHKALRYRLSKTF